MEIDSVSIGYILRTTVVIREEICNRLIANAEGKKKSLYNMTVHTIADADALYVETSFAKWHQTNIKQKQS